ncbi:MAG: hypothetical protein DI535_09245 [Citrobacter freundii]|nr:MAG: hypothetical protein DI535_09245 [Citrobacter freundii]
MKKIIIAIDQNKSADKVISVGYEIAQKLNAEIILLHVINEAAYYAADYSPLTGFEGAYSEATAELINDIEKGASAFLDNLQRKINDPLVKTALRQGDSAEAIVEFATEQQADLIVMGTHRHHGIENVFLPDVAVHVLKHASTPLLTVPTG